MIVQIRNWILLQTGLRLVGGNFDSVKRFGPFSTASQRLIAREISRNKVRRIFASVELANFPWLVADFLLESLALYFIVHKHYFYVIKLDTYIGKNIYFNHRPPDSLNPNWAPF